VAWNSALLYDMIMTQPVLYRFGEISVPTLLMIGQKDTTAIAKDFAPPELRPKLGNYPELGKAAAKAIPGAKLVELHKPDLIVLGSHGHRGMGDLVHGTSVERLRHRVKVPVLVIPAGAEQ